MVTLFTKEDKIRMDKALTAIADVKKDITKAKLAGIDVSDAEKRLTTTEASLLAIKRVYFPAK